MLNNDVYKDPEVEMDAEKVQKQRRRDEAEGAASLRVQWLKDEA